MFLFLDQVNSLVSYYMYFYYIVYKYKAYLLYLEKSLMHLSIENVIYDQDEKRSRKYYELKQFSW